MGKDSSFNKYCWVDSYFSVFDSSPESNWTTFSLHIQKSIQKWIKDLRSETVHKISRRKHRQCAL